ncbi:GNAT family N-acetyltransferase [Allobranchiibius sp. GilTou38]|uniref:GNAT family N-acetyltransferase n=1 Tax=Allobranchiibius sp. GilTou38 TaxID=2815210 RepID=UPI001AA0EBAF|nr:GNAT family N-acetyltransferase [Allobranchiibius sp. GilTou38]MBO1765769.1 GNAT family N-acetyltransferase [Allobranchiibius sp. GilTou38]
MPTDAGAAYDLRPPSVADAAELARLHVRVWQEAYRGLLSQDYLDAMDPAGRREKVWRARIDAFANGSLEAGGHALRIARQTTTGSIAGFCQSGPARDEDPPQPYQLMALNVLAAHHGSGVAQRLVAATVGDRPAYLWVLTGNERAIAFYCKLGFELDGVTLHDERLDGVELRMVRA